MVKLTVTGIIGDITKTTYGQPAETWIADSVSIDFGNETPDYKLEQFREIEINGVKYTRKLNVNDVAFLGHSTLAKHAAELLPVGSCWCYSDNEYVFRKFEDCSESVCRIDELVGWKE